MTDMQFPAWEDWKDLPGAPAWPQYMEFFHTIMSEGCRHLPVTARLAAWALGMDADASGQVTASLEMIAGWCSCTMRTASTAMKILAREGYATRIAGGYGRRASRYQLRVR